MNYFQRKLDTFGLYIAQLVISAMHDDMNMLRSKIIKLAEQSNVSGSAESLRNYVLNKQDLKPILALFDAKRNMLITDSGGYKHEWISTQFQSPHRLEMSDGSMWVKQDLIDQLEARKKEEIDALRLKLNEYYSQLHEALGLGSGKDSRLMWDKLIEITRTFVKQ